MPKSYKKRSQKGSLAIKLLQWYNPQNRNLPWKNSKNPYLIWLSEIILQQTRVAQGTPYYLKFKAAFPSVYDLANAPIDEVLKLWEGLGYYSRARNLHFAANYIVHELDGIFPKNYNSLLKLKGVGEYTAAAIASFAYNEPVAVIDGNVYRVLSRIFGIFTPIDTGEGKKLFRQIANEQLDVNQPAIYNQAIMDFGATFCTPQKPNCAICPFQIDCVAFQNQTITDLPVKSKKLVKKHRFFNYILMVDAKHVIIQKRNENDIWKGLYEFPKIESSNQLVESSFVLNEAQTLYQTKQLNIRNSYSYPIYKQTLSHQKIKASFTVLEKSTIENMELKENQTLILKETISNYAFPKIVNDFLNDFNL